MKKMASLLCACAMLSACAAGINHNTVVVDNIAYLVETPTRNLFGIVQWSEPSVYTNIGDAASTGSLYTKYKKECQSESPALDGVPIKERVGVRRARIEECVRKKIGAKN
jgi:hypothetical protein